jgi:5-methylthioadenosine/S-adenosylhomocysteine deaminase
MPVVHADLAISSRWILPMASPGEVLENHTLLVRDGRILDVLPTAQAAQRYAATVNVDRSAHVVLPGLVNAYTKLVPSLGSAIHPERLHDGAQLCVAEMLKAGTTCFCALGFFPEESARTAAEQGMRALIGIPIAEVASPWAVSPGEYLTRALSFRDEYRGHPTIGTAFAPYSPATIADGTFRRVATLADELDAGVLIALHESLAELEESVTRHGARPLERMHALGLLTPALTAVQMVHVTAADIALAQRTGVAVTLCPESNFLAGNGPPPVASWAATGLRLGVGNGVTEPAGGLDLWTELRILALLSRAPGSAGAALGAWDALAVATRGGAAVLGLDAEIGTLERGKWADLCCVDLRSPAMQWGSQRPAHDLVTPLAFNGGRDLVSDVWVSGRHLLNGGEFTRLDWPELAARVSSRRAPPILEED